MNKRVKMNLLNPDYRSSCFDEVALGYTEEEAITEAKRCINCKNKPCVAGCPVNTNIPDFIAYIANGEFEKAYLTIIENNPLPAVCGRVCPQENQCEKRCTRGIKGESVAIGALERFAADWYMEHKEEEVCQQKLNGHKVAVIGSGPSGLACAKDLSKMGYEVTIFEALHEVGGVLTYGIPSFRLPKNIVKKEIDSLRKRGVKINTNIVIGKTLSIQDLFEEGFKAIYIATGAGLPRFMGIEGESLIGVYSANEFLTRVNLMKAHLDNYDTPLNIPNSVAVVGGGNVAMDAARTAKRLGCKNVYIVYRRSMEEMPARLEEILHAKEENIDFKILCNPIKILGENNKVTKILCTEMELSEPDDSGRKKPVVKENSEFTLDVDMVIMAIGNSSNPLVKDNTPGLSTNAKGCIIVNDDMQTSMNGVYAGGDAATGAATVILAMGSGRKAASSIDKYIKENF